MHSILFKSHLIIHSGTKRGFKDTQKALEHSRHSESTRAFGHSESTQRALREHSGTWMALGYSEGTQTFGHFKALGHLDT